MINPIVIFLNFIHLINTGPKRFLLLISAQQTQHVAPRIFAFLLHNAILCVKPKVRRYIDLLDKLLQIHALGASLRKLRYLELWVPNIAQGSFVDGVCESQVFDGALSGLVNGETVEEVALGFVHFHVGLFKVLEVGGRVQLFVVLAGGRGAVGRGRDGFRRRGAGEVRGVEATVVIGLVEANVDWGLLDGALRHVAWFTNLIYTK